jgi:exosortase/archaeosortase family protein
MNALILKMKRYLEPFYGIILFFAAMFIANFLWKLSVRGDEVSNVVTLFGMFDLSGFFNAATHKVAEITYQIVHFFDSSLQIIRKVHLIYPNTNGIKVIWGCSGIKQIFIFLCIMLAARGSWRHKLWFIPIGLIICYLINILRIAAITMITKNHPDMFVFFHAYVFKYFYYVLIFLIWVLWEEKIVRKKR